MKMNFASKYVYHYDESDEESVSDDEFEHGMTLSSSESDEEKEEAAEDKPKGLFAGLFGKKSAPVQKSKPKKQKKSHWRLHKDGKASQRYGGTSTHHKKWRQADTNIVSIMFDVLTSPNNMHTGDPEYCGGCGAVLSKVSHVNPGGEEQLVWKCEFCSHSNIVDLMPEEMPQKDDVTYMLQPAPTTTASGKSGKDQSLVVFCVDISGSMCVTTKLPGNVKLRGSEKRDRENRTLNPGRENQFLPGEGRNVTYISRLQGMQAAVDAQLEDMKKEHPHRRVALITFNNEVTVIGDGRGQPIHFSGDKLSDKEAIIKAGMELDVPNTINETRNALGNKVFDLEEGGATALGPALLMAVAMASQVKGSKVILCTDGQANVGLGSLEGTATSEELQERASEFYTDLSGFAVEKGVSVSVTTIKGTDCRLVELGKVTDATGGQVNVVDPLKLTEEFGNILSDRILATNVTATFLTHAGLYVRDASASNNKVVREIGNVSADTEITFEFGVKTKAKKETADESSDNTEKASGSGESEGAAAAASVSPVDARDTQVGDMDLVELPFQLQVKYTDLDGAVALRVLTQNKPVTNKREIAEKDMDLKVVGVHTAQTSAVLAKEGYYTESRLNALVKQRLVARKTRQEPSSREQYINFYSNIAPLEHQILQQQRSELDAHGRNYSDDEDEEEVGEKTRAGRFAAKKKKLKSLPTSETAKAHSKVVNSRHRECSDSVANTIYNYKAISSKAFK